MAHGWSIGASLPEIEVNELTLERLKDYTTRLRLRLQENGLTDAATLFDAKREVFDAAIEQAIGDSSALWDEPSYWRSLVANIRAEQAKEEKETKRRLR